MNTQPARERETNLTPESFERLLAWLHSDREEAGRIYEDIRSRLITGFRAHGCCAPDDLADQTIDRVAIKSAGLVPTYVGEPARYFYRVAHYVHLEHLKNQVAVLELTEDLQLPLSAEDVEPEFHCLEQCLKQLTAHHRELVLKYYQGEKKVKIEARKRLALALSITLPALRLQAQRIRVSLKQCIQQCLGESDQFTESLPGSSQPRPIVTLKSEV